VGNTEVIPFTSLTGEGGARLIVSAAYGAPNNYGLGIFVIIGCHLNFVICIADVNFDILCAFLVVDR